MDRVAVVVALGSNLSPRDEYLAFACKALRGVLAGARCSTVHDTEAQGVSAGQGRFLNQVVVGETAWSARELLEELLAIEGGAGRLRPFPGASRTLDLDLILFDGLVINELGLTVPHPRFRERSFVLEPLAEVAPWFIDPVTGESVIAMRDRLRQAG